MKIKRKGKEREKGGVGGGARNRKSKERKKNKHLKPWATIQLGQVHNCLPLHPTNS